jgi:pimeloyl-ACP methyl ester carboxylesterase
MPKARNGSVEIYYETFNDHHPQAILLINGLGAQLNRWPEAFCNLLGARGYRTIRMDNRDVGLSTWCEGQKYSLSDMVNDCIAVLDAAGVKQAHIAGVSMGGFLVQKLAIEHRSRVLSMTSIMSATGSTSLKSTPEAAAILGAPMPNPATDFEAWLEQSMKSQRIIESPGYLWTDDELRERCAYEVKRAYNPYGVARQRAAIMADGDRTPDLNRLDLPTVVLHGTDDPLVMPIGGEATAKAIKGAELRMVPGMGHNLPPGLYGVFVDAILAAVRRAESSKI